jgi:hypothetical protein
MTLVTGTPIGNVDSMDDVVLEGAPYVYFQDALATPLHNPDANGYYWGMSGTVSYPVDALGCIQDVSFGEDVTVAAVRCDTVGDKDVVQKRNYLEVTLTLLHLLPLSILAPIMNISTPTVAGGVETAGLGKINNNVHYMVYMPKVYDEVSGDWIMIHLHRCKFVDAWSIAMASGEPWKMTGVRIRAFIDENKPAGAEFGTILRADPSMVP